MRLARHTDIPALQALIVLSGRELSAGFYSPAQAEAIVMYVFGVDTQLIDDGTYFVIEEEGVGNGGMRDESMRNESSADESRARDCRIVACGGWSRRRTLFGGDQTKRGADPLLDPATEAARIRAFFVHPSAARRGYGRMLMNACLQDARAASFRALELVATLPGEPLYLDAGFSIETRFDLHLPGGIDVPVSRMRMSL